MEPYAEVEDIVDRWGYMSEKQSAQAETLLADVSERIRSRFKLDAESEGRIIGLLRSISCNAVARALPDYGASYSQSNGDSFDAFGESRPLGKLDLTYDEVKAIRAALSHGAMWTVSL